MDKNLIIGNLKRICLNTKSSPELPSSIPSPMWSREGMTVFLEETDTNYYYEILRDIINDPLISYNFSLRDIEKSVQEIISRVLKTEKEQREKGIIDEVDSLLSNLNKKIDEWTFIIPIENLTLTKKRFRIGDIVLFKFTKHHARQQVKKYMCILNNNKFYKDKTDKKKDITTSFYEHDVKPLLNYTCGKINVKGTLEGAQQIAIKRIDAALSCIKLYSYPNDVFYRRHFGIKGEIIPHNTRSILRESGNKASMNPLVETVGYLYPFELDNNRLKFITKNGFGKLVKILNKEDKADFEKRLLNAIYWYSKASDIPEVKKVDDEKAYGKTGKENYEEVEYFNLGDKFLKLMVAMECLLLFGKEPKSFNLKTRSSYILTDKRDERIKLQKYMANAYETRCRIVHEGSYIVSKTETNEFMNYVQAIIIALLKYKDVWRIKTNENLYQWFEKNRLRDRT